MKFQALLALNIGILLLAWTSQATAAATRQEEQEQPRREDDARFERQSDFDFPGPRRAPEGGRSRTRHHDPPVFEDFGGDVPLQSDDGVGGGGGGGGGFQEERAPVRSFRPRHQQPSISDEIGSSGNEGKLGQQQELTEEEQKPEPDRLELLLKESKFACSAKKPGYYADDGLSCEVFHYCNEGVRHSWMCPAGTVFHQIHLICMQEAGDNICKQSSKYYVVNDYLYKPLVDSTRQSNGTIRYADRYFPSDGEEAGGSLEQDRGRGQQSFRQQGSDEGLRDQGGDEIDFRGGGGGGQQFFDDVPPPPPPSRHSNGGGSSRFRPSSVEDESQFSPQVSSVGGPSFANEDHGSFAPVEDTRVHFLPPQNRFRSGGRSSSNHGGSRALQFPLYDNRDV